jgi:predicted nucleotidyltransferase
MRNVEETLKPIANWCQAQPIQLCVLFGSQVMGQTQADSDVDIAVWPAEPVSTPARLSWLHELETILEKQVDLVLVSAELDPVLGMEIVRHGRLIFEREPDVWLHHRSQLWFAYTDSLPFLRVARQRLRDFAEEVRRGA